MMARDPLNDMPPRRDPKEHEAKLRMERHAPDMLALLEELVDIEGPQPGTGEWASKTLNLIATIKGG